MPSSRSKLIWDQSAPLSDFVTNNVANEITTSPSEGASLKWQMADYLLKIAKGYFSSEAMPQRVRHAVVSGKLIATGIRELPSISDGPVKIPPRQFVEGQFRLLQNALESGDFRYRSVRLIDNDRLAPELLADRPNQQLRKLKIAGVFSEILQSGELTGKLRKQQIPIVRNALGKSGVDNIGSDKTIDRLIRIYCGPIKPI